MGGTFKCEIHKNVKKNKIGWLYWEICEKKEKRPILLHFPLQWITLHCFSIFFCITVVCGSNNVGAQSIWLTSDAWLGFPIYYNKNYYRDCDWLYTYMQTIYGTCNKMIFTNIDFCRNVWFTFKIGKPSLSS